MSSGTPFSRLIVGLGNPGQRYANNRHNVGFMVIDALAARAGVTVERRMRGALVAGAELAGVRVLLAKPQTYMNLSGRAVHELMSWYRLDTSQLLIIFDDMDLPLGKLRLRERGNAGGHRGMQSIIQHLGTSEIPRLRIGIGRPALEKPEEYVLMDFLPEEQSVIASAVERAVEAVETVLRDGMAVAMSRFN